MHTDTSHGLIFDIQGHSVHDGPGSRTLVFLSGCPLRCLWCCNPEGLLPRQQLMFKGRLCARCPQPCVDACPAGAITVSSGAESPIGLNRQPCDTCASLSCVKACYRGGLQISGRWLSVDDLMRILNRDRQYWQSRGGVTFSGGEPLLQRAFVKAVLARCREAYIQTALETTCHIDTGLVLQLLPLLQWLFTDIKHMDPEKHREGTGVDNALILSNIRAIAASDWEGRLIVRSPVIPGFNDTYDNAEATAGFLKEVGLAEVNLLPFHRLGTSKYEQLGMPYRFAEQAPPPASVMAGLARIYEAAGLRCYLGPDTPF